MMPATSSSSSSTSSSSSVVVFFVVVLDLVLEVVFRFGRVRYHRLAVFVLGIGVGLDGRFDHFDGFLDLVVLDFGGLFLDLLVLGLLGFLVIGDDDGRGLGCGLRNPGAALLEQRFGLEGEGAFGAFDRPLLQIVEAGGATGTDALGSEIRLGQGGASGKKGLRGLGFAMIGRVCQSGLPPCPSLL